MSNSLYWNTTPVSTPVNGFGVMSNEYKIFALDEQTEPSGSSLSCDSWTNLYFVDLNDFHKANAPFTLSCDVKYNASSSLGTYSNAARNFFTFGYHVRGRNLGEITVGTDSNSQIPVIGCIDTLDTTKSSPVNSTRPMSDNEVHRLSLVYNPFAYGEQKMMLFDSNVLISTGSNLSHLDFAVPDRKLFFGTSAWTNETSWNSNFDYADVTLNNIQFTTNASIYPDPELAVASKSIDWSVKNTDITRVSPTYLENNICAVGSVIRCKFSSEFPINGHQIKVYYKDSTDTNTLTATYVSGYGGDTESTKYVFDVTIPSSGFDDGAMALYIQFGENTPIQKSINMYVDNTPVSALNFSLDQVTGEFITVQFNSFTDAFIGTYTQGSSTSVNSNAYQLSVFTSNDTNAPNTSSDSFINNDLNTLTLSNVQLNVQYYIYGQVTDIVGNVSTSFPISGLGYVLTNDVVDPSLNISSLQESSNNTPGIMLSGHAYDNMVNFDVYAFASTSSYDLTSQSNDIKALMLANASDTRIIADNPSRNSNDGAFDNLSLNRYYDGSSFQDMKTEEQYYVYVMNTETSGNSNNVFESAGTVINHQSISNVSIVSQNANGTNIAKANDVVRLQWDTRYYESSGSRFNTAFGGDTSESYVTYSNANATNTQWVADYTVQANTPSNLLTYGVSLNTDLVPTSLVADGTASSIYVQHNMDVGSFNLEATSTSNIKVKSTSSDPILNDIIDTSSQHSIRLGYPLQLLVTASNSVDGVQDTKGPFEITFDNGTNTFNSNGSAFDSFLIMDSLAEYKSYDVKVEITNALNQSGNVSQTVSTQSNVPSISGFSASITPNADMTISVDSAGTIIDTASTFNAYLAVFSDNTKTNSDLATFYSTSGSNIALNAPANTSFDIPTISFSNYYDVSDSDSLKAVQPSVSNYYLNLFVQDAAGIQTNEYVQCTFNDIGLDLNASFQIASDNSRDSKFATVNDTLTLSWQTNYLSSPSDFDVTVLGESNLTPSTTNNSNWSVTKQVPSDFSSNGLADFSISYIGTHSLDLSSPSTDNIYIDVTSPSVSYSLDTSTTENLNQKVTLCNISFSETNLRADAGSVYNNYEVTFSASNATYGISNVTFTNADLSTLSTVQITGLEIAQTYSVSASITDPSGNTSNNILPANGLTVTTTDTTAPNLNISSVTPSTSTTPGFTVNGYAYDNANDVNVYVLLSTTNYDVSDSTDQTTLKTVATDNSSDTKVTSHTASARTQGEGGFTNFAVTKFYNGSSLATIITEQEYYVYLVVVEVGGTQNASFNKFASQGINQQSLTVTSVQSDASVNDLASDSNVINLQFTSTYYETSSDRFNVQFNGSSVNTSFNTTNNIDWTATFDVQSDTTLGNVAYAISLSNDSSPQFSTSANTGVFVQHAVSLSNVTLTPSTSNIVVSGTSGPSLLRTLFNDDLSSEHVIYRGNPFSLEVSASNASDGIQTKGPFSVTYDSATNQFNSNSAQFPTSLTFSNLLEGQSYDVTLNVTNALNQSASNVQSATTLLDNPSVGGSSFQGTVSTSGAMNVTIDSGTTVTDDTSSFNAYVAVFEDNTRDTTALNTFYVTNTNGSNVIQNASAGTTPSVPSLSLNQYYDSSDNVATINPSLSNYYLNLFVKDAAGRMSSTYTSFTYDLSDGVQNLALTSDNSTSTYAKNGDTLSLGWSTKYTSTQADLGVSILGDSVTPTTSDGGDTWNATNSVSGSDATAFANLSVNYVSVHTFTETDLSGQNIYVDNTAPTVSYDIDNVSFQAVRNKVTLCNIQLSESNVVAADYTNCSVTFTASNVTLGETAVTKSSADLPISTLQITGLTSGEEYYVTASVTDPAGNVTNDIEAANKDTMSTDYPIKTVDTSNPVFVDEASITTATTSSNIQIDNIKAYDVSSTFNLYVGAFVNTVSSADQLDLATTLSNNVGLSSAVAVTSNLSHSNLTEATANPLGPFTFSNYFTDSNGSSTNPMVSGDSYNVFYFVQDTESRDNQTNASYAASTLNISMFVPSAIVSPDEDQSGVSGGMLARYNFTNSNYIQDTSGNQASFGVTTGNVSLASTGWVQGNAVTFSDCNSKFSLSNSPFAGTTNAGDNFALSLWLKPDVANSSAAEKIVVYEDANRYLKLDSNNNVLVKWSNTSSGVEANFGSLSDSQWNHLVVNFDNVNDTIGAIVNNVAASDVSSSVIVNTNDETTLNVGDDESIVNNNGFQGSVDDIRFYNKSLSTADINSLYLLGGKTAEFTFDNITVNVPDASKYQMNVAAGSGKYNLDSLTTPFASFLPANTYVFKQNNSTNATHPLFLSTTSNATDASANIVTSGVSYYLNNVSYSDYSSYFNAFDSSITKRVEYQVPASGAPSELFFHCGNHQNMGLGGKINVDDSVVSYQVSVSSGKFYLDNVEAPNVVLHPGFTYKFYQTDATNNQGGADIHPFFLQHTSGGVHLSSYTLDSNNGVKYYVNNVEKTPVEYDSLSSLTNTYVEYTVPASNNPYSTLYYVCGNHNSMGATLSLLNNYSETVFNDNSSKGQSFDVIGDVTLETENPIVGDSALIFDGNSYIQNNNAAELELNASSNLTMSFWYFNGSDANSNNNLVGLSNSSTGDYLKLGVDNGNLSIDVNGTSVSSTGYSGFSNNQWYQLTYAIDSANSAISFYVDGNLVSTDTTSILPPTYQRLSDLNSANTNISSTPDTTTYSGITHAQTLNNGDIVYSHQAYSTDERDAAQLFDSNISAWHYGYHTSLNTTSTIIYKFTSGSKSVNEVEIDLPGGAHLLSNFEIFYGNSGNSDSFTKITSFSSVQRTRSGVITDISSDPYLTDNSTLAHSDHIKFTFSSTINTQLIKVTFSKHSSSGNYGDYSGLWEMQINGNAYGGLPTSVFDNVFVGSTDASTPASSGTKLDDLQLYNTVFTASELTQQYTATRNNDGLLLRYDFEQYDLANSNVYDESGNNQHGTIYNAESSGTLTTANYAISATALEVVDEYIEIPSSSNLNGTNLNTCTFAAWVNTSNVTDKYLPILHKDGVMSFGVKYGTVQLQLGDGTSLQGLPSIASSSTNSNNSNAVAAPTYTPETAIATYEFNSNLTDSIASYDASLPASYSSAVYDTGYNGSNYAITFDGTSNQYLDLGTDVMTTSSNAFTLSSWFKITDSNMLSGGNIIPLLAKNNMFNFGLSNGAMYLDLYQQLNFGIQPIAIQSPSLSIGTGETNYQISGDGNELKMYYSSTPYNVQLTNYIDRTTGGTYDFELESSIKLFHIRLFIGSEGGQLGSKDTYNNTGLLTEMYFHAHNGDQGYINNKYTGPSLTNYLLEKTFYFRIIVEDNSDYATQNINLKIYDDANRTTLITDTSYIQTTWNLSVDINSYPSNQYYQNSTYTLNSLNDKLYIGIGLTSPVGSEGYNTVGEYITVRNFEKKNV